MPSLQELVLLLGILYDCSCGARDHDLDVFRNVLESRKGGLWTSTALRRCESNDEDTMCYPIVYARDNTASEFGILRDMGHAELVRDLRTKVRGYYTRGHKER